MKKERQPKIGTWWFGVFQSWKPRGEYATAKEAEAAGRAFCEEHDSLGVLEIGQWTTVVVNGPTLRSWSLPKEGRFELEPRP